MKYILITGGVISGLGKGVITSSVGILMKSYNLNVTAIKIDPYLNIDAGTMSPFEHGEVFVLDDGGEVDLDLGNYERALDIRLTKDNNITTGKIYNSVIQKERRGDYLGKTVQVIPHICDEIQDWISRVAQIPTNQNGENPNICLIELGGTIGDIESMPFVEALNQLRRQVGNENFCHLHVSLVPVMSDNEHKTKPTQNSIKEIRRMGLYPDFILCRSSIQLTNDIIKKISFTCYVDEDDIISCHDVKNLFSIPIILSTQRLNTKILNKLDIPIGERNIFWSQYNDLFSKSLQVNLSDKIVKIGIVGKYNSLKDSYLSIVKALEHVCLHNNVQLEISWIDSEKIEKKSFSDIDGILIPGGFGKRGLDGKIFACKYARENNIPFLGICFGLQIAAIEFARNVLGLENATSEEFVGEATPVVSEATPVVSEATPVVSEATPVVSEVTPVVSEATPVVNEVTPVVNDCNKDEKDLVVINMPDIDQNNLGGTMRLGSKPSYPINVESSKLFKLYDSKNIIHERHRHRYEINPKYIKQFENAGLIPVIYGFDTNIRCEAMELLNHPYYVAVQFHPEFMSTPYHPSPPFLGLISAILDK
jgi:CTP synthase